jgi:hypothetical protein
MTPSYNRREGGREGGKEKERGREGLRLSKKEGTHNLKRECKTFCAFWMWLVSTKKIHPINLC